MNWKNYGECEGQISLFDVPSFCQKTVFVATDFLREVILRGTGFVNGKQRVKKLFEEKQTASERIQGLKKEYGLGGWGSPLDGYGLCGASTFNSKGITVEWKDEEGKKEDIIPWKTIEKEISSMINEGAYCK